MNIALAPRLYCFGPCRCEHCDGPRDQTEYEHHEGHLNVRKGHPGVRVLLDGVECSKSVWAAHAGEGWVAAYRAHYLHTNTGSKLWIHWCGTCMQGYCSVRLYGKVELRTHQP